MVHNILVTGEAYTDYPYLKELDGVTCDDDFASHLDKDVSYAKAIVEGFMSFKLIDDKLITHTLYKSNRKLTSRELESLAEYTQGQWSDGIGEVFEQQALFTSTKWADNDGYNEVYISPWCKTQELKVSQEKVG